MRLGYACINTELRKQNVFCSRTCRLNNYSQEKVIDLADQNCKDLKTILEWNVKNNVQFMRVSSDLLPFYDHCDWGWHMPNQIQQRLQDCTFYTDAGNRLTTHPGPYTVLSSDNPEVRKKAKKTLMMHSAIGFLLYNDKADYRRRYVINIHVGRNFSEEAAKIFCAAYKNISNSLVTDVITVENDDKPNGWTVQKLHKYIYEEVGIPIVFDYHHHRFCNEGDSPEEALELALSTWGNRLPKVHYSESKPGSRPQAHSDLVKSIPSCFGNLDVMVEAKLKEQSIRPFIEDNNNGSS